MPITVPAGVEVSVAEGNVVTVKGPKGTLVRTFHHDMIIEVDGPVVTVSRPTEDHLHKSLHGLSRSAAARHGHRRFHRASPRSSTSTA
jgi:large subunit ribosomal protein L6